MRHGRIGRLAAREVGPRATVLEARGFLQRLLGLAMLRSRELPDGHALLLRRCSSVHTFGMRFALDLAFADDSGNVLRVVRGAAPRRVWRCPGASVVLECRAGEIGRFLEGGRGAGSRLAFALDPG